MGHGGCTLATKGEETATALPTMLQTPQVVARYIVGNNSLTMTYTRSKVVTNPVYQIRQPIAEGIWLSPLYKEVNRMMPIVAMSETKAKKATLFLVSNLCVIVKQMTLESISAMAVAEDIKYKFPGIVSRQYGTRKKLNEQKDQITIIRSRLRR